MSSRSIYWPEPKLQAEHRIRYLESQLEGLQRQVARLSNRLLGSVPLQFKLLSEGASLPKKSGEHEACYDICCVADDDFTLNPGGCGLIDGPDVTAEYLYHMEPGDSHIFHTGLACSMPEGYALFLWDRSGMGAKRNIHRLAGVIDSTYTGQILVSLINLSSSVQIIQPGDKIIQAHLSFVLPSHVELVNELPWSARGENGFGSTGR